MTTCFQFVTPSALMAPPRPRDAGRSTRRAAVRPVSYRRARRPAPPSPVQEGTVGTEAAADVVASAMGLTVVAPAVAKTARQVLDEGVLIATEAAIAAEKEERERQLRLKSERSATYLWNLELKSLAKRGDVDACLDALDEMRNTGVKADAYSYSTVLGCCARRGATDIALDLYARMSMDRVRVDEHVLVTLIGIAGRASPPQLELCRALFHRSHKPSLVLCNVFLDALARAALIDDVENVLQFMRLNEARGMAPDAYTAAAVARCYINAGRVVDARDRLLEMLQNGVPPSPPADCLVLGALGREGLVDDARAMFERAPRRSVVMYNVMIGALANGRPVVDEAFALFERMLQEGLPADRYTLHALMRVCIAARNGKVALHVYEAVKESEFMTNSVSYRLALHAAAIERDGLAVSEILNDVRRNDAVLRQDATATLVAAYVRCADLYSALHHTQQFLLREGVEEKSSFFSAVTEILATLEERNGDKVAALVVDDLRRSWGVLCGVTQ